MSLFDVLTPPSITEGKFHGSFAKGWFIFVSAILSFFFVTGVSTGAIFYHWYQIIAGIETNKVKDNSTPTFKPRQPYKDIKHMKYSDDLRYYALQLDLDLEVFKIQTKDGYVLTLHHLVDPKVSQAERDTKEPILLQHGLLSCSGAFLTSGYNSLAYYLLEQGYDVWLGNNRSWFEVNHATLEGNLMHSEQYWNWDVRHLAYYDLPCIIDNILSHKPNHSKLVIAGHSQGSCQSFLMLKNANLGEYQKKVKLFIGLAPAIFPGSLFHHRRFIKFIHFMSRSSYKAFFGFCSFLPVLTDARKKLHGTRLFGWMSYIMFKYLFGWNGSKWGRDHRLWHRHFIFNVTFVSSKLMSWWLAQWVDEGFSNQLLPKKAYMTEEHCDFTPVNTAENARDAEEASIMAHDEAEAELTIDEELVDDTKTYFPYKKRWFGIDKRLTTVPMLIFIGKLDFLVDGDRLVTHLRHYERKSYKEGENLRVVELDDHSHVDVVWAEDVIGRIGYVIDEEIQKLNTAVDESRAVITEKIPETLALPNGHHTILDVSSENTRATEPTLNEKSTNIPKDFPSPELPQTLEVSA